MKNRSKKFAIGVLVGTLGVSSAFASGSSKVWPSKIWTDWYKHGLLIGGIELMNMRRWLEKHNLHDTNVALPNSSFHCDPNRQFVRTADGSCNDLSQPAMGAAGIRFGRNIPLSSIHVPTDQEIMDPNPREVSRAFLTRDEFKPVSFLNLFAATWIQFQVHDWISHGDNEPTEPFLLPLAADDPFGQPEMMILRSQRDTIALKPTARFQSVSERRHGLVGRISDLRKRSSHTKTDPQFQRRQALSR